MTDPITPTTPRMTDAVKLLDWRPAGHDGQSLEASALGLSVFYRIAGKPGDWTMTRPGASAYVHTPGFETRASAQAAAQSDFDARVRPHLVTPPPASSADLRAVDDVDVQGWAAFKGHHMPTGIARHIADSCNARATLSNAAPSRPDHVDMPRACRDVMGERVRQMAVEGWTPAHDDDHDQGQMAWAASCYARNAGTAIRALVPTAWPWAASWWKPTNQRRDLVKAGALIIAEIERLDRAAHARGLTDRQLRDQITGGGAE